MKIRTSNEEYVRKILKELKKMDYIRPEEIPDIHLYMDQVTTFMDEHLKESKRFPNDKMLTKTMINNYTKNNLLPSPVKKKYSKEHMLLLIFIYYFKNILTISDIQSIFGPLTERFYGEEKEISLEEIYKEVFSFEQDQIDALTRDVIRKFKSAERSFDDVKNEEDREFLITFTFICLLSFDVYVKKMMIEKLIDNHLSERFPSKNGKTTENKKA